MCPFNQQSSVTQKENNAVRSEVTLSYKLILIKSEHSYNAYYLVNIILAVLYIYIYILTQNSSYVSTVVIPI